MEEGEEEVVGREKGSSSLSLDQESRIVRRGCFLGGERGRRRHGDGGGGL